MALRTVYDALIDDDGSNLVGTFWDKARLGLVLDERESHVRIGGDQVDITTTGTLNDHDPGVLSVRCNNATALVVSGRVPRFDGEIAVYENVGSSTLKFTNQDAGSLAANRFILSAAAQWIGAHGAIGFRYDGTSDRWRVLFVNPGTPISLIPSFNAAEWTASTGTWTVASGNLTTETMTQRGKLLRYSVFVSGTTTSATPATLRRTIPGGFTSARSERMMGESINSGVGAVGMMDVVSASAFLSLYRDTAGTAWSAAATQGFIGQLEIEVS